MVTPNYRLGVLGFLKVHGGDYNCGLWDQVREHLYGSVNVDDHDVVHGSDLQMASRAT